eukprot:CAMPEP_0179479518 /NCGR_PEP_ID=MMETSP0799-20121207/57744_1 /TAXON_ID=46947 /ORGANISM="Geminigera cryophila, Strain CCMP2564" /LENGTH=276 /DNA_ID=CAMNT_0021291201 /DNA_START=88 /DNA_END=916 /DNA_ORIENTATION=+
MAKIDTAESPASPVQVDIGISMLPIAVVLVLRIGYCGGERGEETLWTCARVAHMNAGDSVSCEGPVQEARKLGDTLRAWLSDARQRASAPLGSETEGSASICRGPVIESAQYTCRMRGATRNAACDGLWQLISDAPSMGSANAVPVVLQTAWAIGHLGEDKADMVSNFTVAFASSQRLTSHLQRWLLGAMHAHPVDKGAAEGGRDGLYFQTTLARATDALHLHTGSKCAETTACTLSFVAHTPRMCAASGPAGQRTPSTTRGKSVKGPKVSVGWPW